MRRKYMVAIALRGLRRDYVLTYRIVDMSHLVAPISKDVTDQGEKDPSGAG
ncbi:MAG: hypothetical protein ACE5MK_13120 [Acidobacteriota bacterium]